MAKEKLKRVGAALTAEEFAKLGEILDAQKRSFTDWVRNTIEMDYREMLRRSGR